MTINYGTPPYREDPIDVKAKGGFEEHMRFDTIGRVRVDPTPWPYTTMGAGVLRDLAEALPERGNRPVVVSLPLVNNYERADSRAVVFSPVDEETSLFGAPYLLDAYLENRDREASLEVLKP